MLPDSPAPRQSKKLNFPRFFGTPEPAARVYCEAVVGSVYNFVHDEAISGHQPARRGIRSQSPAREN